jgi:hypothetical protein
MAAAVARAAIAVSFLLIALLLASDDNIEGKRPRRG